MDVSIQRYGDRGCFVSAEQFDDLAQRQLLDRALVKQAPLAYLEHVWGAEKLFVMFRSPVPESRLLDWFAGLGDLSGISPEESALHEVPVVYDGPDLVAVATATGLSVERLIAMHAEPEYRVRMMGFSPGFPYLDGLNPRLQLARRESPRKRIEPGAVAIGGPHAGIYSVASPGGWHLLGRTDQVLFRPDLARGPHVDAAEVFAFRPGDRIRFVPVRKDSSGEGRPCEYSARGAVDGSRAFDSGRGPLGLAWFWCAGRWRDGSQRGQDGK